MNKQARVVRVEAGQALETRSGPQVLLEGELLVQAPAQWLGGMVFLPPAMRFVAPAMLDVPRGASVLAVHASTVRLAERAPLLPVARWLAAVPT